MQSMWWFVGAVILGIAEVFTLDLTLLMLAGGALAAGGVALVGAPFWVCVLVFCAVAALLLFALRPYLLRSLRERTELVETNAAALVGRDALVLATVSEHGGRVKLHGEVWSARTYEGVAQIEEGTEVKVVLIDGATAVVVPKEGE